MASVLSYVANKKVMQLLVFAYTCARTCARIHVHAYMFTHTCVRIDVYAYMCTHLGLRKKWRAFCPVWRSWKWCKYMLTFEELRSTIECTRDRSWKTFTSVLSCVTIQKGQKLRVFAYTCAHTCARVHLHAYMCTYTCVRIRVYASIRPGPCLSVYAYMCTQAGLWKKWPALCPIWRPINDWQSVLFSTHMCVNQFPFSTVEITPPLRFIDIYCPSLIHILLVNTSVFQYVYSSCRVAYVWHTFSLHFFFTVCSSQLNVYRCLPHCLIPLCVLSVHTLCTHVRPCVHHHIYFHFLIKSTCCQENV